MLGACRRGSAQLSAQPPIGADDVWSGIGDAPTAPLVLCTLEVSVSRRQKVYALGWRRPGDSQLKLINVSSTERRAKMWGETEAHESGPMGGSVYEVQEIEVDGFRIRAWRYYWDSESWLASGEWT